MFLGLLFTSAPVPRCLTLSLVVSTRSSVLFGVVLCCAPFHLFVSLFGSLTRRSVSFVTVGSKVGRSWHLMTSPL